MPDETERLDLDAALCRYEHAVREGLRDVVVGSGPTRVEDRGGEDCPLPRQEDEGAAVGGEGRQAKHRVEVQGRVEELGIEVMGERVVVAGGEGVELSDRDAEPRAQKLSVGEVHERGRDVVLW